MSIATKFVTYQINTDFTNTKLYKNRCEKSVFRAAKSSTQYNNVFKEVFCFGQLKTQDSRSKGPHEMSHTNRSRRTRARAAIFMISCFVIQTNLPGHATADGPYRTDCIRTALFGSVGNQGKLRCTYVCK